MKNNSSEFDLVETHFPTIYLTIIALIQGIALSNLAGNFVKEINFGFSNTEPIYYARYLVASTIIFLTWHHYMYGIIYLRWFPGLLDTLIPLLLGAAQFIITGIIWEHDKDNWHSWLISRSLFFLIGGFAYLNAAIKTTPLLFAEHYGKELSDTYNRYITLCNKLAGLSCFVNFIFTLLIANDKLSYSSLLAVEFLVIVHIFAYEFFYRKKIKPHYLLMLRSRKDNYNKRSSRR